VYRLLPGQESTPEEWVTLTNNPVPALYYNDIAWATLPTGKYIWAVITCYAGNVVSEPEFSDELEKIVTVPYTIRITTNSGDLPTGADVTLEGPGTYTGKSGPVGISWDNVITGDYTLDITFPGFNDFHAEFEITKSDTYNALLIEIINDPYNLKVEPDENTALFTWSHDALKPFLGFTIYLDGVAKAAGLADKQYLFTNLANGTHIAGVQAVYASGKSEIVTKEFISNSISEPDNDFALYPNPAQDFITVERLTSAPATIDLYNAMGAHVKQYEVTEQVYEIEIRTLAAGTYFIRVSEDGYTGVKSFVKK
jgi:hypothetical protein